jgi:hypothetical protein
MLKRVLGSGLPLPLLLGVVLIWTLLMVARTACAKEICSRYCGDPTGDGRITLADGVQVLREAVLLPSTCKDLQCDTDGSGSVGVTDAVAVLRRAAGLNAKIGCNTGVGNALTTPPYSAGGGLATDYAGLCLDDTPPTAKDRLDIRGVGASSDRPELLFRFSSSAPRLLIIGAKTPNGKAARGFYVLTVAQAASARVALNLPAGSDLKLLYTTALNEVVTRYSTQRVKVEIPAHGNFGSILKISGLRPLPTTIKRFVSRDE